jgi:hypothetical protein
MPRGSSTSAEAYIDSRQDQKSSSGTVVARTSTRPRRFRWKACECPLTSPGTSNRPGRRTTSLRSPAPDASTMPTIWSPSSSTAAPARTLAAGLEHEIGDEQAAGHGSMGRSRPRSRAVSRASA